MTVNRYLDKDTYKALSDRGLIRHIYTLKVRWVPSAGTVGNPDIGWVGYSTIEKNGKLLSELKRGIFTVKTNAIYINEAYIRIVNPYPFIKRGNGGEYRNWVCTHIPEDKEEFISWPANGRIAGVIVKEMHSRGIVPSNIHEYMFRVFRTGQSKLGLWNFEVFFHDHRMPKIPSNMYDTNGNIYGRYTGIDMSDFRVEIPYQPGINDVFTDHKVASAIAFLKDVIIPTHPTIPDEGTYMDWFKEYCEMGDEESRIAYIYRKQLRLP